jgi:hypothetical protein
MLGFDVSKNGVPLVRAGLLGSGVVSVIFNRLRHAEGEPAPEFDYRVGGLDTSVSPNVMITWTSGEMVPGDEFTVRVLDLSTPDVPSHREPSVPRSQEEGFEMESKRLKWLEEEVSRLRQKLGIEL